MDEPDAILVLAALAQPTRLTTFRLLIASEPEGVSAGDLARRVGVPQNTMSAHLATLVRAGLVAGNRQSRSIIYCAAPSRVRDLTLFLVNDCCGGQPGLCTPLIQALTPCCPEDAVHA
jgi:ArsR family transcriptional regulator, arsenate/arsenite/antimonite-responsive transcriptional repressor